MLSPKNLHERIDVVEYKKSVDESWKESVDSEKKVTNDGDPAVLKTEATAAQSSDAEKQHEEGEEALQNIEVNFINYVTSLTFQALIFLGEIPNPMNENKMDRHLGQAKFLIDTLVLVREKTQGNLTKEEEELLNASVYELQMKYVEASKNEASKAS